MPLNLTAKAQQVGAGLVRDGFDTSLYTNRERALQVNSREGLVDLWTRQGRVWTASNPVIGQPETMSANGTVVTLTAPSLRFTAPAGSIICPIHVQFAVGQVTAKNNLLVVLATASDSYSSGGDAVLMAPYNALVSPNTAPEISSTVTNLHYSDTAIVEGALVRPRCLKHLRSEGLADASVGPTEFEYNILKGDAMTYLVGPASFLVFLTQETTAAEAEWSMSWAVLEPGAVGY